jgi:nitrous oxidase accessory protein NosD
VANSIHVKLLTLLLLTTLFPIATLGIREVGASSSTLKRHAPILIDGPSAFTQANGVTSGSGTANDPFIIQGWSIDASTSDGIVIRNILNAGQFVSPMYFVIRNVFIHSETRAHADIVLDSDDSSPDLVCFECPNNVFSGVIANSTLTDNGYGIVLANSNNIEVSAVTIKDVSTGLQCLGSSFLQIRTNRIASSAQGMNLDCSVTDAFYNSIIDTDFGFLIGNFGSLDLEHNSVASPRGFTLNRTGSAIIANNQITGVAGLTTQLFQYGIDLAETSGVSIDNNTITNSGPAQIQTGSSGVNIESCPVDTVTGQPLSCDTAIIGNTISAANSYGVSLFAAQGVIVFHNNFVNNTIQAFDQTGQNTWDNGYPSGGNFWSDYPGVDNCSGPLQNICPSPDGIGDTPYMFNFNEDHYPLMTPFS